MSKNRVTLLCWPIEVYDYEKKSITDEAVGGIDLRKGCWIHCKWCNSTLKTSSFSLASWNLHQARKTHQQREQEFLVGGSQPQFISCSSQSSVRSLPPSLPDKEVAVVGSHSRREDESLVLVRRDLHLNKQYQARQERDVTNVINAMTSLIADQQSDINQLHHQVHDMTREIQGLKKNVELLRRNELQRDLQAPQKKGAAVRSHTSQRKLASRRVTGEAQGGQTSSGHNRINRMAYISTVNKNGIHKKKNDSVTDMDIFERRFQLTGADNQ